MGLQIRLSPKNARLCDTRCMGTWLFRKLRALGLRCWARPTSECGKPGCDHMTLCSPTNGVISRRPYWSPQQQHAGWRNSLSGFLMRFTSTSPMCIAAHAAKQR
jgi:hypothetical protein